MTTPVPPSDHIRRAIERYKAAQEATAQAAREAQAARDLDASVQAARRASD